MAAALLLVAAGGYTRWRARSITEARAVGHTVVLRWVASREPVDGYKIYRTQKCGVYTDDALNGRNLVTTTTYTDLNVPSGTYCYAVRAVIYSGAKQVESANSNEVMATVPPVSPAKQ